MKINSPGHNPTKLQRHVSELIAEFLNQPFEIWREKYKEIRDPEAFGKEFGTLQIQLPRGVGSTRICLELAKQFQCLVIVLNENMSDSFRCKYASLWPTIDDAVAGTGKLVKVKPADIAVASINTVKKETKLLSPDIERLKMISDALRRSKLIVFDVFRAYADNSAVKKLYEELGYTHRFIMFR